MTSVEEILNYIGNEYTPPSTGEFLDCIEPATGEVYARVPRSSSADVDAAVNTARRAFPSWSAMPAEDRSNILLKIASLIEEHLDELAMAETKDNGKPLHLSRTVEIPRAAANFRFFATAILHTHTEAFINENRSINYTLRQPLGVVGTISPWNLPLYLFTWKVAPALAAGNTVVAKPSEITPFSAYLLTKLCEKAGLPAGVLNVVHGLGDEVGRAITSHPGIKAISFTGSTKTGETIARTAAPLFKKISLEMGGKNPVIIFDDCNYEQMLTTTLNSSFRNQGQICFCGSRIYVQDTLYDKFLKDFVAKTRELRVGDPEQDVDVGAVVSAGHLEKILFYISLARTEGGQILTGGKQLAVKGRCQNGYFVEPTIITGLDQKCRTNQEEIFGPVVTVQPFTSYDEVVRYANGTRYGLSAVIWSQNLDKAHKLAADLKAGIIWVNTWMNRDLRTYFGGMKDSGVGREGGFEALRFFTEPKNVCINFES